MSHCEFNVADIRQHRRGIHMPKVEFEPHPESGVILGELVLFGRSIPVISAEQVEQRLRQINCNEEKILEIIGNLSTYFSNLGIPFGYVPALPEVLFDDAIPTETTIAVPELADCLV